jgi:hypothetical protein
MTSFMTLHILLKFAELCAVFSMMGNISSAPSKIFELQSQMVRPFADQKVI